MRLVALLRALLAGRARSIRSPPQGPNQIGPRKPVGSWCFGEFNRRKRTGTSHGPPHCSPQRNLEGYWGARQGGRDGLGGRRNSLRQFGAASGTDKGSPRASGTDGYTLMLVGQKGPRTLTSFASRGRPGWAVSIKAERGFWPPISKGGVFVDWPRASFMVKQTEPAGEVARRIGIGPYAKGPPIQGKLVIWARPGVSANAPGAWRGELFSANHLGRGLFKMGPTIPLFSPGANLAGTSMGRRWSGRHPERPDASPAAGAGRRVRGSGHPPRSRAASAQNAHGTLRP